MGNIEVMNKRSTAALAFSGALLASCSMIGNKPISDDVLTYGVEPAAAQETIGADNAPELKIIPLNQSFDKSSDGQEPLYWWYASFRMSWPENTNPDFSKDMLIADAAIKPILKNHIDDLVRWRFHRRAGRDGAGHRFSFIFYATVETARDIYRDIENSRIVQEAVAKNLVEAISFDDLNNPQRPDIEDTSDPGWPLTLQKQWPDFIMGMSSTWLGLIGAYVPPEIDVSEQSVEALQPLYRQAEVDVNQVWVYNGNHSFFHHTSAIFGYQPTLTRY